MTLLEYLDARHARRMALRRLQPNPAYDGKLVLGALFFLGYYGLVFGFAFRNVPAANIGLLRDAMLVLGPPVGAIVNAIWRTDRRDEESARNTGEFARAVQEQAKATSAAAVAGTAGAFDETKPAGTPDDPVNVQPAPTAGEQIG